MRNVIFSMLASALFSVSISACALKNDVYARGGKTDTPVLLAAFADYAGAYSTGPLDILQNDAVEDYISAVPPFWGSKPYFIHGGGGVFTMALPHPVPERTVTFYRDENGDVIGLELDKVDGKYDGKRFRLLAHDQTTPAQLFMKRHPREAAAAALADHTLSADDLYAFALQHLLKHPTRNHDTVTFLQRVSSAHPDHAGLMGLYGYALVSVARRDDAREILQAALTLDPEHQTAREGARRLALTDPKPGEGYRAVLPFSLEDAFAAPTDEEIAAVRADWARRDLSAQNISVVHDFELTLKHAVFEGKILRHTVSGQAHYGAVFVPKDAAGPLPIVIDARGVNFFYSPLDVTGGTKTMLALGDAQSSFVFVIPSMRGHKLIVEGREFAAEGDPSDAWDGAADDSIALLNTVIATTPQADSDRIAIIGYSRGGTVALLAGARDDRIGLVLNVVGPVDHFKSMDQTIGWTWAEILADDMADGKPSSMAEQEEGSQVFDHFFDRVLTDNETLADVRRRMLASSPLFFVESLPVTHSYYGAEDTSVPRANAAALRARLKQLDRLGPEMTVRVFEGRGHDTDPYLVQQATAQHLARWAEIGDR